MSVQVIDRLLAMKPGDINPAWIVLVIFVALGIGVWLQRTLTRASDRLLDRWFRRK